MTKQEIIDRLKSRFGADLEVIEMAQPEPYVYIAPGRYHDFCEYLKNDPDLDFDFLFQLAGVHYPEERFEVALTLCSHERRHNMVAKAKLDINQPEIESVADIWMAGDWYEREAMELFGIKFINHPDPRPLLLDDDWDFGYPLRKGWTGPDFIPMPEK